MAKKLRTYKTKSVLALKKGYSRFTAYLTPSLLKRLKRQAVEEGTDVSTVVRAALEAYLPPERVA